MTIGDLAQRLRVSTRTLRHYDAIGLLVPQHVDPSNGYRIYGADQLVRGMQIEQLKAAGLSLTAIKSALDGDSAEVALRRRREEIGRLVTNHTMQLAAIDALLDSHTDLPVPVPELVDVPARHVVVSRTTSTPTDLGRTIRREIQQVGRSVRRTHGIRCRSFSARFPLTTERASVPVEVAGHLDEPTDGSILLPAETQLRVVLVGNISLLPMAYDVVLNAAHEQGLQLVGTAVEHYLDLAAVGRTEVAVPITSRAARVMTE